MLFLIITMGIVIHIFLIVNFVPFPFIGHLYLFWTGKSIQEIFRILLKHNKNTFSVFRKKYILINVCDLTKYPSADGFLRVHFFERLLDILNNTKAPKNNITDFSQELIRIISPIYFRKRSSSVILLYNTEPFNRSRRYWGEKVTEIDITRPKPENTQILFRNLLEITERVIRSTHINNSRSLRNIQYKVKKKRSSLSSKH